MYVIRLSKLKVDKERKSYEIIGSSFIQMESVESLREYHPDCNIKNIINMQDIFALEKEGKLKNGSFPTEIKLKSGKTIIVAEMTDYISKIFFNSFIKVPLTKWVYGYKDETFVTINPTNILAVQEIKERNLLLIEMTSSETIYAILDKSESLIRLLQEIN